jgi:hypothetical protein
MPAITKYQVVQPGDLGSHFTWDVGTSKWKLTGVSADDYNLLSNGTDGQAYLATTAVQGKQKVYSMAYSTVTKKIELSEITPNADGTSASSVVISSVDPIALQGQLDEITITNGSTITFTDQASPDITYTCDFSSLMGKLTQASNSISLSGDGKAGTALTATLILDPSADNMLKVSVAGTMLDKNDVLALLNTSTSITSAVNTMTLTINGEAHTANIVNSHTVTVDSTNGLLKQEVNGVYANVAIIELTNSANVHIGYTFG